VFSIGDFAAVGRVSVRMLRHYDAIGLLTPAKTDPATGYRMDEAFRSMQILARWIDDNGYKPVGYAREVCLQFDPENPANWVHEFQLEVARP